MLSLCTPLRYLCRWRNLGRQHRGAKPRCETSDLCEKVRLSFKRPFNVPCAVGVYCSLSFFSPCFIFVDTDSPPGSRPGHMRYLVLGWFHGLPSHSHGEYLTFLFSLRPSSNVFAVVICSSPTVFAPPHSPFFARSCSDRLLMAVS